MVSLFGLDPGAYTPSALHGPDRVFRETNCYVDLWIELLHAQGIDPGSAMSFACATQFEGDQWTFFKPPPELLLRLYGIDVHEMQLYRPIADHVVEQIRACRSVIIEADSFYLPDRVDTSYRSVHEKSSIAIEAMDPGAHLLRYFHGAGYYELSGEDYCGVFRIGREYSVDVLPPYVEIARFDAGPRRSGDALMDEACVILREQVTRMTARNPWLDFGRRLCRDLPGLLAGSDRDYHVYAFATLRQCGAAFECAKSFVDWLRNPPCRESKAASEALDRQVNQAKTLLFKLARRRPFDPLPFIEAAAADWEITMRALDLLSLGVAREAV
ncbi:MAG: DUF1839 family protein [Bryobacteraceae bacterium]